MTSTLSLAQTQNLVLLKANDPSPYTGILMPESSLRLLQDKALRADLYKKEFQNENGDIPVYVSHDGSLIVTIAVAALLVGVGIGLLTR
jgi:hypothetical protein